MSTNRDLNYRLYLHRNNGFVRTPFTSEFGRYSDIRDGRVEQVKLNLAEIKKDYLSGKGVLSLDAVRNVRYHVIIAVAMISRACVDGGMNHDMAYTLSDIYIQRADVINSSDQLIELLEEMQLDFAERMRVIRKNGTFSIHIRRCIDYIYDHLEEKLTLEQLSRVVSLNPSYLSKLFLKETGINIKDFVHQAKISTAENMLAYSEFSCSEIALSLGFCSQSAFSYVFRQVTGTTPKKYRNNFNK